MKKLMIAAVMTAMTSAALAQTSIYGILDASVHAINNAAAGSGTNNAMVDSAVTTSRLGFRGSEDLGGGMRAIWQLESDAMTNNGGTHQSGLFRRGAYVGVQGRLGELTLGNRGNPIIATHASFMPLAGNSFDSTIATAFGYSDFFTKNAVTYASPTLGGLRAQIQHGLANTAGLDNEGSITAGSVRWEQGRLTVMAAAQDRKAGGTTSSANSTSTTAQGDVRTRMGGVQIKVTSRLTAAAAYVNNEIAGAEKTNSQYGLRYDVTPVVSVGASYMTSNSEKNDLTNLQVRYALSKRTTLYSQYSVADNGATSAVRALNTTTGTSPAANISGLASVADATQRAFGVGVIHSF